MMLISYTSHGVRSKFAEIFVTARVVIIWKYFPCTVDLPSLSKFKQSINQINFLAVIDGLNFDKDKKS